MSPSEHAPSAEPQPTASGAGGLAEITAATVVAGAVGYLILGLVPKIAPAEHLGFVTFWSALYLLVAALSGLQQEVTRAASPIGPSDAPGGGLVRLAAGASLAVGLAVVVTSPLWAPAVAPRQTVPLVAALAVALMGYVGVAVLSGVFFGLKLWRAVALMTIVDAVARLALVAAALAGGHDLGTLGWAVAAPFGLSAGVLWLLFRGRVVGRYRLDAPAAALARNALKVVGGAVALGVLTSGLPLLIGIAPTTEPAAAVKALVNVVIMTRAPLVIPILALQGWLTVFFRDRASAQPRPLLRVTGGVLAVTVLVAAAAFAIEPWLLVTIWGPAYAVDAATCALVVLGAGLTAALCVSGPATLAAGRHTWYLAGWAAAALVTVALFWAPLPLVPRALLAMAVGPVVGMVVHTVGVTSWRN